VDVVEPINGRRLGKVDRQVIPRTLQRIGKGCRVPGEGGCGAKCDVGGIVLVARNLDATTKNNVAGDLDAPTTADKESVQV
jgi:hypothetical protein